MAKHTQVFLHLSQSWADILEEDGFFYKAQAPDGLVTYVMKKGAMVK